MRPKQKSRLRRPGREPLRWAGGRVARSNCGLLAAASIAVEVVPTGTPSPRPWVLPRSGLAQGGPAPTNPIFRPRRSKKLGK